MKNKAQKQQNNNKTKQEGPKSAEAAESAARCAEAMASELQQRLDAAAAEQAPEAFALELVEAKILAAELEYDKEVWRGKANKLARRLDELGGAQLQVAQHSTKVEVKLAQSLQEVVRLREENEALQQDVMAMVELKLRLAELEEEHNGE